MMICMELREMKSLIALSECGSIQEAGARCNLSPAAIHKHLKILESEFGVRLYTKKRGRLALTEAGLLLIPFFRDIVLRCGAAQVALEEWKGARRGLVRIGAGPAFSSYLLPALVKRFRRSFPNVDVFIETGDSGHLIHQLKAGAVDLVFDLASAVAHDNTLQQLAAWESEAGFISAASALPAYCELKTLQNEPFILFREDSPMGILVQNYLSALNFVPHAVMRSDSAEAIKAMVLADMGVSLLFLWNIDSDTQKSRFSFIKTEAPPFISRIALVRRKADYTPRAVNEFVALARGISAKHFRPVRAS
jgi:DNA-binding transcriptional LysR family regulator